MRRGKGGRNGLLPSSLRIISSCLKTVSSNAGSVASTVRSAGASVAASIAPQAEDEKDQVLWAGFDKLEFHPSSFKHVLLVGYSNGFQMLDVEDAANVCELVSKRDGPVTFLQMQPTPVSSEGIEGFRASHPMLLVVAGDETNGLGAVQGGRLSALIRDTNREPQSGNCISTPTVVRFYSLRSHTYVHVLRFRSAVYLVRCSPRIVAVALAAQIYCFDAVTLENKLSVLSYPLQGSPGVNIGYGPMTVGPRWLAYASNTPLLSNTGRLSPQNLTPSPGVSPSTSPSSGSLVARYAVESSKQIAAGIINLGDMGYKTLSKYCQELLPDGSNSPLSSSPGRRSGKIPSSVHPLEADNAGMVVIKDFTSKVVISQFRAHTSPISALCFDPSGTLLVTASVHGHNINVFRITPTCVANGSSAKRYDWTASHVHLYKLYRGMTAAVIQDISFSHFSQWISIVSSRGTCHIFTMSPFGGDASLQPQNSHSDGPPLAPCQSRPWWSKPSFLMDQQLHQVPSTVTNSVVSRIKNSTSGWLNTVSNVAASASGKLSVPSGAVTAVFHNSIYQGSLPVPSKANALEHLLVYSPSGHVIQHELLPSSSSEPSDSSPRVGSVPNSQLQDDELHVTAEPIQWWDVCRRTNWPERDENIANIVFYNKRNSMMAMDASDCEDSEHSDSTPSNDGMCGLRVRERSSWYLSNAEVQISSWRIPIWQKSKICFYVMDHPAAESGETDTISGGEIEIEKLPLHEVEIRRRELLPVFKQFQYSERNSSDRNHTNGGYQNTLSHIGIGQYHSVKDSGQYESKPVAPISGFYAGNMNGLARQPLSGPSSALTLQQVAKCNSIESPKAANLTAHHKVENENNGYVSTPPETNASTIIPQARESEDCVPSHTRPLSNYSLLDGSLDGVLSPANSVSCKPEITNNSLVSNSASTDIPNGGLTIIDSGQQGVSDSHNSVEFTQFFQEGYCKISELDDCRELTEAVTDADSSSSHCEREKPEEDGDNDDMLGGVFAFSEEG
ncbi:autophagy-related protein 18h-like isoform X2 [Phragmites australis]|uniref:autophagy-related protein 18h-like isoform X2 n=1 Tax=Phragmites australis TaxID=29695 RepID=UPI002D796E50|nr:autophagy-related protein 18h-like isoform X2 [Phragmites australis]